MGICAAGGAGRGDGLCSVGPGAIRDWCVTKRGCQWGIVYCCFSPPPCLGGGGLGPSFAYPIQQTCPRPMLPGLQSCYHRDGYPCACEWPVFAITRARDVHEWGSTGEGWEGGDSVVWSNFRHVCHGCESVLESKRMHLL
jgi:hypothetical protein